MHTASTRYTAKARRDARDTARASGLSWECYARMVLTPRRQAEMDAVRGLAAFAAAVSR